jgi:predicted helicase
VCDFSRKELESKIDYQIQSYDRFLYSKRKILADLPDDEFVQDVKWTRHLKNLARKAHTINFESECVRTSFYRPYVKQQLYFSYELNEFRYQIPSIFPKPEAENALICFTVGGRLDFSAFSTNAIPSLTVLSLDANQCLPLWRYDDNGNRIDNITDWALKQFRTQYPHRKQASKQASIGRSEPEKFPHPDRKDQHLPLHVRRAARSGVPREIRAEPQARIPAHSVLRRFLALGQLGQCVDGFAHWL